MNRLRHDKRQAGIKKLVDLYNLDAKKLANADQTTIFRTLERDHYQWNGTAWVLPPRPWMAAYRKEETPPEKKPAATKDQA